MSVVLENFTQDFVELIRYTQSPIESEEEVLATLGGTNPILRSLIFHKSQKSQFILY